MYLKMLCSIEQEVQMFQAYKMKMVKTPTRVRSYIYKNCSVCFSREEEGLVVSIAPHYDLSFPDKEELDGLQKLYDRGIANGF